MVQIHRPGFEFSQNIFWEPNQKSDSTLIMCSMVWTTSQKTHIPSDFQTWESVAPRNRLYKEYWFGVFLAQSFSELRLQPRVSLFE